MTLKLHDDAYAPSPRRVRMFAAEKGIALERIPVSIASDENRGTAFLTVNPLGEVPVLELEDGTRLTESLAICRYLEALQPEPCLMGRSPLERAQLEALALQLMFRVYVPTTHAFRHTHKFWATRLEQIPQYGAQAREHVLGEWRRIDRLLADRPYIGGEQFSYADIVAFTTLEFGKPAGVRVQDDQTHLRRWHGEIAARASAKA